MLVISPSSIPNRSHVRKAVRPVMTTPIYKSSDRWLLFKQTQPCCLNMAAVHVRRSGRQDDSTGRTTDAGLGKMGSIILLVAPDRISCPCSVLHLCARKKAIILVFLILVMMVFPYGHLGPHAYLGALLLSPVLYSCMKAEGA